MVVRRRVHTTGAFLSQSTLKHVFFVHLNIHIHTCIRVFVFTIPIVRIRFTQRQVLYGIVHFANYDIALLTPRPGL